MKRGQRRETIRDVIARLTEDFPDDQSIELATKVAGEVSAGVLREYAIVRLEQDVSEVRRRRTRELERASRLSGKPRSPSTQELRSRVAELLDDYAAQIQIDWTAQLRASTFAIGDGTTVSWGKATVEQHEARIVMLDRNVRGNLDGIRHHEAAIKGINESGVASLDAMVRKTMASVLKQRAA